MQGAGSSDCERPSEGSTMGMDYIIVDFAGVGRWVTWQQVAGAYGCLRARIGFD